MTMTMMVKHPSCHRRRHCWRYFLFLYLSVVTIITVVVEANEANGNDECAMTTNEADGGGTCGGVPPPTDPTVNSQSSASTVADDNSNNVNNDDHNGIDDPLLQNALSKIHTNKFYINGSSISL